MYLQFDKRKPSKALIMRTIGVYISEGVVDFDIRWGENGITLEYNDSQEAWHGSGWIKDIGGADIADELTAIRKQARRQLLNLWNT